MAKFRLSYITDVEILFQHYHCLRSGNHFDEFLHSCRCMLPLMAAYGNVHYLGFLAIYYWQMMTLADDDKDHMSKIYSFSLSGKTYSKLPPDQVVEMTMNKQSRNRRSAGWVGFTKTLSKVAISILSRSVVLCLREELQQISHSKKNIHQHPEMGPSRMKKDFQVIADIHAALDEWNANPWDRSQPVLQSLCTGQPASEEVRHHLFAVHDEGEDMAKSVLAHLSTGGNSIYSSIKRLQGKTFTTMKKVRLEVKRNIDRWSITQQQRK